jgi:hypothetical protein
MARAAQVWVVCSGPIRGAPSRGTDERAAASKLDMDGGRGDACARYLLAVVLETESALYDYPEPPPYQNTGGKE